MYSKLWRTIAIQYETSDSTTYNSTNNDRCSNLCNSREECKNHQQIWKIVEIVITDEKSTVLSSPEGLIEGIQEFDEKTGLLVADSLVSVIQGKVWLKVLNMRNEANDIYHDSKTAHRTDLWNQILVNGLFSSRERLQHQEPFGLANTLLWTVQNCHLKKKKYR